MYRNLDCAEPGVRSARLSWIALATVAAVPALLLSYALVLICRSASDVGFASAAPKNSVQEFAYWQDWSTETEQAKTLQEALQMERRAWEMTRQDTCSWEAGDPPAQPRRPGWGIGSQRSERCRENGEPTDRLASACWKQWVQREACPRSLSRRQNESCGLTWHAAYDRVLQKLGGTLDDSSAPLSDASLCDDVRLGRPRSWTKEQEQKSLAWFHRNVEIYVLEMPGLVLDSAHETLASLSSQGLRAAPVAGYDLNMDLDMQAAIADGSLPADFDLTAFKQQVYALSLAASHFHIQNLARRAVPPKPITLVLEDGVALAEDFRHKVWSLIQEETPCDWNVLSLSSGCPVGRCTSPHLARIDPNLGLSMLERCQEATSRGFRGILYRTGTLADFQTRWMQVAFDPGHPDCPVLASISIVHHCVSLRMKSRREARPKLPLLGPEFVQFMGDGQSEVDIWSMGCIFTEINGGPLPYEGINTLAELTRAMLVNRRTPVIPPSIPAVLLAVISACYQFDGRLRPSAKQVYDRLREAKKQLKEDGLLESMPNS
ncbi:pyk3 [Symbiodinium natans]|uniref:Pyk3 protein n=1 Tax=Symbiodinium natans TaxID=878477 RepID=A0A812M1N9_9DINO|nr:pyk3 [Symbiodinium natans]